MTTAATLKREIRDLGKFHKEKPHLTLLQDMDNPDLWCKGMHAPPANWDQAERWCYTTDELRQLNEDYHLILVSFHKIEPPDYGPSVELQWPD